MQEIWNTLCFFSYFSYFVKDFVDNTKSSSVNAFTPRPQDMVSILFISYINCVFNLNGTFLMFIWRALFQSQSEYFFFNIDSMGKNLSWSLNHIYMKNCYFVINDNVWKICILCKITQIFQNCMQRQKVIHWSAKRACGQKYFLKG